MVIHQTLYLYTRELYFVAVFMLDFWMGIFRRGGRWRGCCIIEVDEQTTRRSNPSSLSAVPLHKHEMKADHLKYAIENNWVHRESCQLALHRTGTFIGWTFNRNQASSRVTQHMNGAIWFIRLGFPCFENELSTRVDSRGSRPQNPQANLYKQTKEINEAKTYNSRNSLVITHLTTNLPIYSLY